MINYTTKLILLQAKMTRFIAIVLTTILIITLTFNVPIMGTNNSEILWDTWGVPHIYASDSTSLFKAFGWAQTKSHGNLILRLYGQARGKAAEYWGINYLESDQYVTTMGISVRAQQWYEQQTPEIRQYLDSFAQGINNYVAQYPQEINEDLKVVLPITGTDILAHFQRVIHFHFLTNPQAIAAGQIIPPQGGSNGWVISPKKSASGKAMLLANPHLPWSDFYLWYEAQLNAPGVNMYGAALVGMPILALGFNDNLGWTVTVNPIDGADTYQLKIQDDGYLWEGKVKQFDTEIKKLKIRQTNGNYTELEFGVKHSVQGVITHQDKDYAYAVKIVGLDRPHGFKQLWEMAKATNLEEFEAGLKQLQIPLFNFLYADKKGQIFYLFNALVPIKSQGDWQYWQKIIPGDTSETLWTDYHAYEDLPRLVNPETGWLQNSNDPPWSNTFPPILKAEDFPPYLAPPSLGYAKNILRSQRSIQLLMESEKLSFDEMINKKFSSELLMADRILNILVSTTKALANPIGIEAAKVLEKWDHQTNANSRGAVLFTLWALTLESKGLFSKPWNPENPLETPSGLADINTALGVLEGVAAQVKLLYGSLDVPWGEVVRMRVGNQDLPANGGPGILGSFQVLNIQATADKKFQVVFGDSFIAAVEFSDPIHAKVLNVYGNSTQPNSPHVGDQLSLYAQGKMRPVWRDKAEIEQHLELLDKL
ncbi:peptidase [Aphanothece sacrum FPU1]|uniref:Peptidase n=2 Tax=Aphanothece sacrum TaxID=1122 RepID=A0A401ILF3_APHSA|nr:peptidase [Aphanothece sacrum FPU1]GBF85002.1 peptidase [Aphanothece sacrum FPU3]